MQPKTRGNRVLLNPKAMDDLLEMKRGIEEGEDFVTVTPSLLASCIITRYRESRYKRDKGAIKSEFFDHRKSLASTLKGARTEKELRDVLARAVKKIGRKQKGESDQC